MDNPEEYTHIYILTVMTGWFIGAGSSSIPTFYLKGTRGRSNCHALFDPINTFFEAGSEKTFLMTVNDNIGELTDLVIWISLSGANPIW